MLMPLVIKGSLNPLPSRQSLSTVGNSVGTATSWSRPAFRCLSSWSHPPSRCLRAGPVQPSRHLRAGPFRPPSVFQNHWTLPEPEASQPLSSIKETSPDLTADREPKPTEMTKPACGLATETEFVLEHEARDASHQVCVSLASSTALGLHSSGYASSLCTFCIVRLFLPLGSSLILSRTASASVRLGHTFTLVA